MALKIRLQRHGAVHAPVFRLVVCESANRRDGRFVEILGTYKPKARGKDVEVSFNMERVGYWMSVGAKPSETAAELIKRAQKAAAAPATA